MSHWLRKYNLLIYNEIDSTNKEARRLIENGVTGKFIVTSYKQIAGYGRQNREWYSPEGNLYLSLILNPGCTLEKSSELSFVTAVALKEMLNPILADKIKLKWPNDVLINGQKIAGILLESTSKQNSRTAENIIIGLGININVCPKDIEYPATSLKELKVKNLIPEYYLDLFMQNFVKIYSIWKKEGFSVIREEWMKNAYNKNKVVTAVTKQERISGVFENINEKGQLVLKLSNNERYLISGGNVYFDNN